MKKQLQIFKKRREEIKKGENDQNKKNTKNYEIMKKNFEIINRGWKQKEGLKKRHNRRLIKSATSATERELKYNQEKLEREKKY